MKVISFSKPAQTVAEKKDDIHVFYQYYFDSNASRAEEIFECLKMNANNKYIHKIHLLNEQIYTQQELKLTNIQMEKIVQTNIGKRLEYRDVFKYIEEQEIIGYHVIINSDIMLDGSIGNLYVSDIHSHKKMFALLRYELNKKDPSKSQLFGFRFDSQDTWIFHSNFPIGKDQQKIFNFQFGKPGCDNKMIYLMNILGYEVINDPSFIKTYHNHASQVRRYKKEDVISKPWGVIVPSNIHYSKCSPSLGIDLSVIHTQTNKFTEMMFEDNTKLHDYILTNISSNKHFIIPRIAGIENVYAFIGEVIQKTGLKEEYMDYIKKTIRTMKNNAGIQLTTIDSIIKYSKLYCEAFDNCEIYAGWETWGGVYPYIAQSQDYFKNKYNKSMIWAFTFDIFHYIYSCPWTHALKGKRVLIVSAFAESINEKIPIREKIYGVDLFPECEIITICPPQTQGDNPSEEFITELIAFEKRLDEIKDTYDIALVSCGGYGNLVCNSIYKQGKSAIYVGGVLQMYFGILGNRWLIERADAVRLFLNANWSRPKDSEKPSGHVNIEKSCYW